jgi:DinB superfamily
MMTPVDYTALSLAAVRFGLEDVARDTEATFGQLSRSQLNWRPDPGSWSVAQCFDHLVSMNQLMFHAAEDAVNDAAPRTIWQRLPILPGFFGRMMVRSQQPGSSRKFTSPSSGRPAASDISAGVIEKFVEQQRSAATRLAALDERTAAQTIMASPFVRVITYSVLDGWRLVVAHDRRHFEQARRVSLLPDFPAA